MPPRPCVVRECFYGHKPPCEGFLSPELAVAPARTNHTTRQGKARYLVGLIAFFGFAGLCCGPDFAAASIAREKRSQPSGRSSTCGSACFFETGIGGYYRVLCDPYRRSEAGYWGGRHRIGNLGHALEMVNLADLQVQANYRRRIHWKYPDFSQAQLICELD